MAPRPETLLTEHAPSRALLLVVPRQRREGSAGLVPQRVLQGLGGRIHRIRHLHAACHYFHPRRPAQGTWASTLVTLHAFG